MHTTSSPGGIPPGRHSSRVGPLLRLHLVYVGPTLGLRTTLDKPSVTWAGVELCPLPLVLQRSTSADTRFSVIGFVAQRQVQAHGSC